MSSARTARLVVTEDHTESAREARRVGASTVEPGDVEGMGRGQLWTRSGTQRSPGSISYDAIAQRMASAILEDAAHADDDHLAQ